MYQYAREKNIEKVIEYQKAIVEIKKVLSFTENWIAAVKYLCTRKGLIQPYTARGIPMINEAEQKRVEAFLADNEKLLIKN